MEVEKCRQCDNDAAKYCKTCQLLFCGFHVTQENHPCLEMEMPTSSYRDLDAHILRMPEVKVCFFGDAHSGKTSLIHALFGTPTAPRRYTPTQSADIYYAEMNDNLKGDGWKPALVFDNLKSLKDEGWKLVENLYTKRPGRLVSIPRDSNIAIFLNNWLPVMSELEAWKFLSHTELAGQPPCEFLARMNDPECQLSDPEESAIGNEEYYRIMEEEYPQANIQDRKINSQPLSKYIQFPQDNYVFCFWNSQYDDVYYVQYELYLICFVMFKTLLKSTL